MNQINNDILLSTAKASHDEALDPINVKLGERIRAMRKLRLMTQSDLAGQLGITFQQVQKYERGKNRLSVAMLLNIARILCVAPELLLAGILGDGDPPFDSGQANRSPAEVAEYVNVMELYCGIADRAWRQRACELLRLLGQATQHAA